ncbi:cytochrome P450 4c3-like [Centruroides sculpturatus]|uniref:cytochrome P450 4c3-like n=1 Tax=Centruroides sculpturatus TaxID=218467 RepID=UPI000C6CD183|nr:cytochrome P450 4c3-like [Centruroides sculpturatus]
MENQKEATENYSFSITHGDNSCVSGGLYIWNKNIKNKSRNEIPKFPSWPMLWNLIFCPVKAQDYRKLCGTFIIQILSSVRMAFSEEKVLKLSWGGSNYILLSHPEVAEEVLKSHTVINKDWIYNILHPWLGTGLLTSSNDKWRHRRKLLTPAFHFRILEDFQEIFNDYSTILIEKLKNKKENEEFLMDELISLCTLDIIGGLCLCSVLFKLASYYVRNFLLLKQPYQERCSDSICYSINILLLFTDSAMGVQINTQDRSGTDYVIAINDITSAIIQWVAKPWYWFGPIFNLSPLGIKFHKDIQTVHEFDRKVIREKKQKLIEELKDMQTIDYFQEEKKVMGVKKKRAFLDLLLYHHLTDGSLNEEDIREEVDTFMIEGHDTTAMGISWTLYLLGLHPDIQEKLYQELEEIFGEDMNKSITSDELKRMKYLECVVKCQLQCMCKACNAFKLQFLIPASIFAPESLRLCLCSVLFKLASYYVRNFLLLKQPYQERCSDSICYSINILLLFTDSAMGVQINTQDRSGTDYVIAINDITSAIIQWVAKPWYWFGPIFNLSPLGIKFHKDIQTVHEFDRKVIREKKQKLIEELKDMQTIDYFQEEKKVMGVKKKRAFLDLLLYHHLTDGSLNEEDIREEVDTFMIEGHDTTAMGISWTLYLLGLHPDIQEKLYQELEEIFGEDMNKSITSDELKRMKYLECVVKESIRIYPPIPVIIRKNPSDMKVGDYIFPAKSSLVINIYGIHHNPTVFENPEVFNPDRFLPENCDKRHPFAFVPFSAGPRNCIGQRFAMREMKTVLSNVIRHFRVKSLDHRDKIFESADVILRPKFGIRMTVEKR